MSKSALALVAGIIGCGVFSGQVRSSYNELDHCLQKFGADFCSTVDWQGLTPTDTDSPMLTLSVLLTVIGLVGVAFKLALHTPQT